LNAPVCDWSWQRKFVDRNRARLFYNVYYDVNYMIHDVYDNVCGMDMAGTENADEGDGFGEFGGVAILLVRKPSNTFECTTFLVLPLFRYK